MSGKGLNHVLELVSVHGEPIVEHLVDEEYAVLGINVSCVEFRQGYYSNSSFHGLRDQ